MVEGEAILLSFCCRVFVCLFLDRLRYVRELSLCVEKAEKSVPECRGVVVDISICGSNLNLANVEW